MTSMSVLKRRSSTMKRKRSDKSKYKHQTTGDHCTCAAYVAEIMCLRNAEHKNKGSLPYKFWNTKPWDWTFKRQLVVATKLIKNHGEEALVKAIHSPELKGVFSLNHRKVIGIINKYALIVAQDSDKKQDLKVKENAVSRKKTFGKKSQLNRLRSIDSHGEEEE